MNAFVVDTNVPVTANGRAEHASPQCVRSCIENLEVVRESRVVLDSGMRIIDEYMKNLCMSGQPGPGDFFMKWVFDNQANLQHCEQVVLTLRSADPHDFAEFPLDARLDDFDSDDKKFAAVAIKSAYDPPILNAVDSDWWVHREALATHGIHVQFLCPAQFGPHDQ